MRKKDVRKKKYGAGVAAVCLTGGLCECAYLRENLSEKLGCEVQAKPEGRFAGAVGAALSL